MDGDALFVGAVAVFVVAMAACSYYASEERQLKCVISGVDGNTYCVRDRAEVGDAADILASTARRCKTLVIFMDEKYPEKPEVVRLSDRFDSVKISETLPTSAHTAYSQNKGEKLAFCLNRTRNHKKETSLIEENTLMFVALHELAHIMTVGEGHPQAFWDNFKFLLQNAVEVGVYSPVDHKKKPVTYCGMQLTDNPYYDL
jgi:hypothetical protein